jgi:hypothetical protein
MSCRSPRFPASLLLILALPIAACDGDDGGDDEGGGTPDAAMPGADAGADAATPGPDAGPPGDWVPLVAAGWSLQPGEEGYMCASKTFMQDTYVGAIRPIGPPGTHHTTVSIGPANGPDDPGSPCGVSFGSFYASGNGTGELVLPDGVALVIKAGEQLRLNLHLFNATDGVLQGTSGIEGRLVDAATVQHEASVSLHGPVGFSIPANNMPYTYGESSPLPAGRTIIAVFPHMHQLGSHFKAVITQGGTPTTIWDEAYQFESQEFSLIPALTTQAGATLETTCTWVNDTGTPVGWGDSSTAEMCFTILMSY